MAQTQKFYPLTEEMATKLRQAKLTAAEWRIWSYLVSIDPWGDRYQNLETLEVMTECDCSKATFYRAIAKFQSRSLFNFQDKGWSFKNESGISKLRSQSQNCEASLTAMRQVSQICENRPPEVPPNKGSEPSQTIQTIQTNSDSLRSERESLDSLLNQLPQSDREKFLQFARVKAAALPNPPQLVNKWIAVNFGWVLEEFDRTYPKNSSSGSGKGSSAHPQKKNNCTIAELKRLYPHTWRDAAAHFGIEEEVEF